MIDFHKDALEIFRLQAEENVLYRDFIKMLPLRQRGISRLEQIPFLPIRFFKTHLIQTGAFEPEVCFESSGTTQTHTSKHRISSLNSYLQNTELGFSTFYGSPSSWCILALLPSYLERGNSSLVAMADYLIKKSGHPLSGFFLHDHQKLHHTLLKLEEQGQKTLLLGVTFALVDFAEQYPMQLKCTTIMETGGMKGRKREMTREELHQLLKQQLEVSSVHAEYGMTEMQSQAYSMGQGHFRCTPTLKVLLRSPDDPFEVWGENEVNKMGVINIIDLANRDTIAFIATDDLGRFNDDGSFEVIGRVDNAEVRGCSQLSL